MLNGLRGVLVDGSARTNARRMRGVRRGLIWPLVWAVLGCSSDDHAPVLDTGDGGVAADAGDSTNNVGTTSGAPNPSETDAHGSEGSSHDTSQPSGATDDLGASSPTASNTTGESNPDPTEDATSDTVGDETSDVVLLPSVVTFDPVGGGFEASQVVQLEAVEGETIHYTLDGSLPTLDSPVYDGPITLTETTIVRAVVSTASGLAYAAQPYVHVESDVADFSSDLPIVVLDRHRDTPIDRDSNELRPSSLLVFMPGEDGRSRLLGPASLAHRAGARVRGAYSRGFAQVGYAVETWAAGVDDDEDVRFLNMPADSDWVLSAPSEIDRALMRNMFAMDLSRALGRYAPRAQFVEVFLVDDEDRDSLTTGDYLGVYTAMEKIKRGRGRVNIAKLRETDTAGVALTGGYMFRIDHDENDFESGGFEFGWVYPDADKMVLPARQPQVAYMTGYLDEFFTCLTSNGFTNPATKKHYSEYIDVPAWIDHHLINTLTKNVDGLRLSSYFYKDRNQRLVAGPIWDFDRSMGTPHDWRAVDAEEWAVDDGTHHIRWGFWGDLFEDPEFTTQYWDRWDELREGALSESVVLGMIDDYELRLTEARERHFDHWTEIPPEGSPEEEVEILRDWLVTRLSWLDAQRR